MTIDNNLSTMLNSLPAYLDPSFSTTVNEQINQALLIQQQIKELTQHAVTSYRKKGYDYGTHVNNILSRDSSYIPPQFQSYYTSLSAPLQQKFLMLLLPLQTYTTTPANKKPISHGNHSSEGLGQKSDKELRKITSTRESYTSLNISDNQLDQIKPKQLNDIFSHLPNLSVLHTSFNQLDQMEQGVFENLITQLSQLPHLQRVNLKKNDLSDKQKAFIQEKLGNKAHY